MFRQDICILHHRWFVYFFNNFFEVISILLSFTTVGLTTSCFLRLLSILWPAVPNSNYRQPGGTKPPLPLFSLVLFQSMQIFHGYQSNFCKIRLQSYCTCAFSMTNWNSFFLTNSTCFHHAISPRFTPFIFRGKGSSACRSSALLCTILSYWVSELHFNFFPQFRHASIIGLGFFL